MQRRLRLTVFASLLFSTAFAHAVPPWTNPTSPMQANGRLALGNRLHVVGHTGGNLVHRYSLDNGATWSSPTTIATAPTNYPMMYGGFSVLGDTLYLLTAAGDMGPAAQACDFRKSVNNGQTWTAPIRITRAGYELRRARIVAYNNFVHVAGQGTETNGFMAYFRSTDGGATWAPGVKLADTLGAYGGGQTLAVDRNVLHIPYTKARAGVGAGDTYYRRSADNGATWSAPVIIGENSAESSRQARVQVVAEGGRAFVIWQREADSTGLPIPPDRLGYNRSVDGGLTWLGVRKLPDDYGVNREHQHVWMTPGGAVHVCWWNGGDTAGYKYSPDFGDTWGASEVAMVVAGGPVPFTLIADANWAHLLVGAQGGNFQYSRRPLAPLAIMPKQRAGGLLSMFFKFHEALFSANGRRKGEK